MSQASQRGEGAGAGDASFSASGIRAPEAGVLRPYDSGTFFAPAVSGVRETRREAPAEEKHLAILCEPNLEYPDSSPFFARLANMLFEFFGREGLNCRLYQGQMAHGLKPLPSLTNSWLLENVEKDLVSGVIVLSATPSPHWMLPLQRRGIPIVGDAGLFESGVRVDYDDMVTRGVTWLAARGCRQPLLLSFSHLATERRLDALFVDLAQRQQLKPLPPCLLDCLGQSDGHSLASRLKGCWQETATRPDGLLVLDDMIFRELLPVLWDMGWRVGRDLQVVTHANAGDTILEKIPAARLELSVSQYAEGLGKILLSRLRRRQVAPTIITLRVTLREPAN